MNEYFPCPECKKPIALETWDDIYDTEADVLNGRYIEEAVYTCPHCGKDNITATIHYSIKFNKVEIQ